MKVITVQTSNKYDVLIGASLLQQVGQYASSVVKPGIAAIISDSNVWPLYGDTVRHSLENAGFSVVSFIFSAGESSKNADTYLQIMNFLATSKLSRSDCLFALGGGVVGDITGFSAATYLRGIAYIQIPTTLLAMVDSSVGGKTAIDLPTGKNLVGAFYQPKLVICDIDTLQTLPAPVFTDGCAEVIKYSILFDPLLFQHLYEHGQQFSRESVISRCIEWKRDVVTEDEFDTGLRQKLNFGHTFGHSVELLSQFQSSHGQAVAIGMDIVAKAAAANGICQSDVYSNIHKILEKFHLPTSTAYTAGEIFAVSLSDKKRAGQSVNLIVPVEIGNCAIRPTPVEQLQSFIEAGL